MITKLTISSQGIKTRRKHESILFKIILSGIQDLNLQPHGPHPCALANCANPRYFFYKVQRISASQLRQSPLDCLDSTKLLTINVVDKDI